jgi:outer membrane protein assembly factor BamE
MNKFSCFLSKSLVRSLCWVLACFCLAGCFIKPYKFDMYQGNVLSPEQVAQIHPGMNTEQVRYVLGTPMLQDAFHMERWDYVYLEKPSKGQEIQFHLTIYFDEGKVQRIAKAPLAPNTEVT